MTAQTGTALAQIVGLWSNPYGSEVQIQALPSGVLFGVYQSTAGSAGKYLTYGLMDPTLPAVAPKQDGQPLGLMINWRSIDPNSKPDPSWNYVSGMSGQIICNDDGDLTLQLNHALIASEAFEPDILPGAYVDRLEYLPNTTGTGAAPSLDPPDMDKLDSATQSRWTTAEDPDLVLTFNYPMTSSAFMGRFEKGSKISAELIGTGNVKYVAQPDSYQAIAFNAVFLDPQTLLQTAVSYSGWIDVQTQTMKLQEYYSTGRKWGLRFFQSRGRTLYFTLG